VRDAGARGRQPVHWDAEAAQLVVEGAIALDGELDRGARTIVVPHEMHEPCLDPSAIHGHQHMEDADRAHRPLVPWLLGGAGPFTAKIDYGHDSIR
jgi:hypothetical protein